jgi:cytochrome b561
MPPARAGYSGPQIALHWAVAVLVVLAYLVSGGMGGALRAQAAGQVVPMAANAHVAFGMSALILSAARLGLRRTRGVPPPPGVPGSWTVRAAGWGHAALYVLLLGVPAGGALVWFGGQRSLGELHGPGGNLLLIVAGGHALVALVHHHVLKDGLLSRMTRAE